MNKYVSESEMLIKQFNIKTIPISYKHKLKAKKFSLLKVKTIFNLYFKLIYSFIRFKPKIVYFQISPLGVAFLRDCTFIFLMKLFKKHIIFHLHGKGIRVFTNKPTLLNRTYRWAFKNSSVICLSNNLIHDISKIFNQRPYIVNNAVPFIKTCFRIDKNKKVQILFLSNLIISKGIIVFLEGISLLNKEYIDKINVSIVGEEAELTSQDLISEIERRNIEHIVSYLGPKYGSEKNIVYNNTDLLIYPSFNDAFPLVLLEAMQYGIPIIGSKEGAIPEIIDDQKTGLLVDKNNSKQIAEKIELLIDNPKLRENMGDAGKEKYNQKYTLDIFEKNMLTVFNDVINHLS